LIGSGFKTQRKMGFIFLKKIQIHNTAVIFSEIISAVYFIYIKTVSKMSFFGTKLYLYFQGMLLLSKRKPKIRGLKAPKKKYFFLSGPWSLVPAMPRAWN
jgi:hypothetical protein